MRHKTTAYDRMAIPCLKGKRREVRRLLARNSRILLAASRERRDVDASACPLQRALSGGAARIEETSACGNVCDGDRSELVQMVMLIWGRPGDCPVPTESCLPRSRTTGARPRGRGAG